MADVNNFSSIKIGIASPETIRSWSHGEVKNTETINYRSQKPEPDGLFCQKIFGPVKDYECACGAFRKMKSRGFTCPKCGVDVVSKKVRRERMGHIELACPVTHIWYLKGAPYRMSMLLDIPLKDLELVVYYAKYIILDPGTSNFEYKQIIDDRELWEAQDEYGVDSFKAGMGAEAVKQLLKDIDLDAESESLKKIIDSTKEGQVKAKAIKRLEVVEAFRTSGNKPEWMVLDVIPVLPPDLRPMVQLDGGKFAASDLNDLYRLVIMRNNRLKKYMEENATDLILKDCKRGLQEAVDALIDNGRRGKAISSNNKKAKSLTESLKGKQGRFRLNLLGKRVDYSGRSVIVVGPELKMYQCGLPREMAIELFKPFVFHELLKRELASNNKSARRLTDNPTPEVWDILEEVIKDHPVLLNRAPSLHRLSIQAFEPVIVEGRAIKLHPLVCTAFNADFDGDQMAVHVPLSLEARAEARFLMLSTNNILKLSDGKPVVSPSQDIVIGCFYLTMAEDPRKATMDRRVFKSIAEAKMAYQLKQISLQKEIEVRVEKLDANGNKVSKRITTSVGKIIFNEAIPQDIYYGLDKGALADEKKTVLNDKDNTTVEFKINTVIGKKQLSVIVDKVFAAKGATETSIILDKIKSIGYKFSTISGNTASVFDMHVPKEKAAIIEAASAKVQAIEKSQRKGMITEERRYKETLSAWNDAKAKVSELLEGNKDVYNPIWMMAESGARGGIGQISQLCGMRGIVSSTSGKDIELPIKSSYREGLSVLEYFISAHGGRKGMADTALKTADSGYLTRRLVDVCHHVVVTTEDCGDKSGVEVINEDYKGLLDTLLNKKLLDDVTLANETFKKGSVLTDDMVLELYNEKIARVPVETEDGTNEVVINGKLGKSFIEKIDGRYTINDIVDKNGVVIVPADTMIKPADAKAIDKAGVIKVKMRSNLSCRCVNGVCAKCYGKNLASGNIVKVGEAVGIIAAQSIGEPGTQLTMRTFHTGGVASSGDITHGLPRVQELFEVRRPKGQAVIADIAGTVKVEEGTKRIVTIDGVDPVTRENKSVEYVIDYNKKIIVKNGDKVEAGDRITVGNIWPQDLLRTKGIAAVQDYIIGEVKRSYEASNVEINEKHLEIIIRQMLRKVRVMDAKDSELLAGEIVDKQVFDEINKKRIDQELEPIKAVRVLQGITKASLSVESFLSSASFQETSKMLTDAAIKGKIDHLVGLKENIIIGKLIPAGTGMKCYKNVTTVSRASELNNIHEDEIVDKFAGMLDDLDVKNN